jgi:NADH-quinone oxidoreductase subunit E
VVGEFDFNSSLFIAVLLGLGVALFLFFAFHRSPEPQSTPARAPKPAPAPAASAPTPQPVPAAAPEPVDAGAAADEGGNEGTRPAALDGPRDGKADDLKKIKGVGPKMEKLCNSLGFYHFDQIANWTADEVAWVDNNLEGFKGRVSRDDWVAQAKLLAAGGETEFSKKVEDGDVY